MLGKHFLSGVQAECHYGKVCSSFPELGMKLLGFSFIATKDCKTARSSTFLLKTLRGQ
jgi:hypothetical protein